MFPNAHELSRECLGLAHRLLGLRWVALCAPGGIDDVLAGLAVQYFELIEVAIKLSCILANESIAFPHLDMASQRVCCGFNSVFGEKCIAYLGLGVGPKEDSLEGFHDYEDR